MLASIELFEALKTRFGEQEAKIIVKEIEKIETSVEARVEKEFDKKKDTLATKEDFWLLKKDLNNLELRLANKLNDHFKWTMATIIAVGGLIVAVIKLL